MSKYYAGNSAGNIDVRAMYRCTVRLYILYISTHNSPVLTTQ